MKEKLENLILMNLEYQVKNEFSDELMSTFHLVQCVRHAMILGWDEEDMKMFEKVIRFTYAKIRELEQLNVPEKLDT